VSANCRWLAAIVCGVAATLACSAVPSRGALLPPDFISAVVALGSDQSVAEPGLPPSVRWVTEGTGFFYGYLVQNDSDIAKRQYAVFLVTAGHVLKEHMATGQQTIRVRLDAIEASSGAQEFEIPMAAWFFHPDSKIDLAATPIPITFLRDHGLQSSFFASDEMTVAKDKFKEVGVSAGDGVFILGFPMNLAGEQRNYVIVRQGAIARVDELLENKSSSFLVDAFVFPGNSGGPVILRPELVSIQGTKANTKAAIVGVVTAYQPYTEVAVSVQTKRPRVAFEENSGLAIVLPMNYVNEMVRQKAEDTWNLQQSAPTPNAPAVEKH